MLLRLILPALALALALTNTGCSTTSSASALSASDLSAVRSVSIMKLPDNSNKISGSVAQSFTRLGIKVDSEALEPGDTTYSSALVAYVTEWGWDLAAYIKTLQITIFDSSSRKLLAQGRWDDSTMHGFRDSDGVVTELLGKMIPKTEAVNSGLVPSAIRKQVEAPKPSAVLKAFDEDLIERVDKWRSNWKRLPSSSPYSNTTLAALSRDQAPLNAGSKISGGFGGMGGSDETEGRQASTNMFAEMDAAVSNAESIRRGLPKQIDGCRTGIEHLQDRLPVCSENEGLKKLRRLVLATDATFNADLASGLTMKEIANRTAQSARQFEEALKQDEAAMQSAAADGQRAAKRLAALKETPSKCDAGPTGSFGMQESAYQAYVSSYMAALANRAVSVIAACRAEARK